MLRLTLEILDMLGMPPGPSQVGQGQLCQTYTIPHQCPSRPLVLHLPVNAGYHKLSFVPRNHLVLAVDKRPTRRIRSDTTYHAMVRSNLAPDDVLRDHYTMDQVAHTPNIR
jgi:hypothetical protein